MNWHDLMDRVFESFPLAFMVVSWNRPIAVGFREAPFVLRHANDDDEPRGCA